MDVKERDERDERYKKVIDELKDLRIILKDYVPLELENTKTIVLASYWLGQVDALKSLGYGPDLKLFLDDQKQGEADDT